MHRNAALLLILPSLFFSGCFSVDSEFGKEKVSTLVASHVAESQAELARAERAEEILKRSPLSLDDAIVAALALHPDTRIAWADLETAQAELMRATTPRNPILEAELRFQGGGIGDGTLFTLIESFISILKTQSAKKGAELAFDSEQSKVANKILGTLFAVKRSYAALYYAQKSEALLRKQFEAASSMRIITAEQRKSGGASELDLAQSNLQSAGAEESYWQEQRKSQKALLTLAKSLGTAELPKSLVLSDSLPGYESPIPDEKALLDTALKSRLDLLAGRQKIEALAEKLGVAENYALIPTLDIGPQVEGVAPSSIRVGAKIVFEFPIFDQGSAEKRAIGADLKRTQAEYSGILSDIVSRIRIGRADIITAQKIVAHIKSQLLPNSRAMLQQSQLLYNGMSIGVFQLLEAKQAELSAEKRLLDAEAEAWDAEVSLEETLGTVLSRVPKQ